MPKMTKAEQEYAMKRVDKLVAEKVASFNDPGVPSLRDMIECAVEEGSAKLLPAADILQNAQGEVNSTSYGPAAMNLSQIFQPPKDFSVQAKAHQKAKAAQSAAAAKLDPVVQKTKDAIMLGTAPEARDAIEALAKALA